MCTFFPPQLGVGVEGVAGPLAGVIQLVQLAAEGILGEVQAGTARQVLPEQGDGPLRREIAEILGRLPQEFEQPELVVLG
jgi:hypothetical protein